jgi:hypothetical protein
MSMRMEYAPMPSRSCPAEPTETVKEYVEGTLATPDTEHFEDHFFQCDACRMLVLRTATARPGWSRRYRQ